MTCFQLSIHKMRNICKRVLQFMSNFGIIITVKEDKKMENQKGNGIFLGVVAVATLIVAIIGATFAYFSIAVNGGEGDVNVSAYEKAFDVGVQVERVYPTTTALEDQTGKAKDGIIPLKASLLTNALGNSCLDKNGYMVCALYKATFTNNGTAPATFNVDVKTTSNVAGTFTGAEAFSDLAFQSLNGTVGNFSNDGTATKLLATAGNTTSITGASVTVGTDGPTEHYFVVYLEEENDEDDQSKQMGASFTGQVVYTTVAGTERLTGTFDLGN